MSRHNPSFATIDLDALKKCRVYELPRTYHLQQEPGNGCAGDAPGYPTYFTRNIYTQHGNSPAYREGRPTMVITHEGVDYVVESMGHSDEKREKILHKLWKPLPLDHPRTRAWILATYQHAANCYRDEERQEHGRPGMLVYPLPAYELAVAKDIQVSVNATPEEVAAAKRVQQAEVERVNALNEVKRERAKRIATPENHLAVICIRKFYPEYEPEQDLIDGARNLDAPGDWWETEDERPTPETCPGKYGHRHPMGKTWCQFCGWKAPKSE